MYFWGSDFETLCEQNCRQYRVYADIYPKNEDGGYDETPSITYTATRGSSSAGAVSFETAAIVSVKIVKGMTSGAFSYGGAFGGQLTLVTTADTKIPANDTKIVISVSFVSDEGQETGKAMLGTFFSESVASGQFTKTIKATDGVSKLNKYYVPDPAEFPMTAMDLFKKAAVVAGVDPSLYETDFKLNNPNITEAPLKKKGVSEGEEDPNQTVYVAASGEGTKYHTNPECSGMSGNVTEMTRSQAEAEGYTKCTKKACLGEESAEDEYYTYREIAGMIASVNAGNAFISALNHLNISTPDVGLKREIPIKSVISYTNTGTVNKFSTTFWAQTYTGEGTPPIIDPLSEEYDPSVMVVDFPLPTDDDYAEMQENIDGQIGGISYNGIVIKKQGTGRQEIGDLLAFNDTYRNKKFDNVLVMGIVYDISAQGGFVETLYSLSHSEAKQQAKGISTNTRVDRLESKVESSGGGEVVSGGVGEFTNEEKNSEIFNDYENNYINPKTPYAHVSGSTNYIDNDENISNNFSQMAAIVGGANNQIKQANLAVIIGGTGNNIVRGILSCIAAGVSNMCESQLSFIGGGNGNKILSSSENSNVICGGSNNKIENTNESGIVAGEHNTIKGSVSHDSVIIGGDSNAIEEGYYNAIIGGIGNKISHNSWACIFSGSNNKTVAATSTASNPTCCFVCGNANQLKGASNCIVCGEYGIAEYNHRLVIGNGSYENPYNVFYVDRAGNAYAKSFNIIDESTSEASTFSARSSDTPDLSELTAQIIESLKANL